MNKTLLVAIAATSLFACGSKKKPADSSGSGSTAAAPGSGSASSQNGSGVVALGATDAGSGSWTDKMDPLERAMADAAAEQALATKKADPSLVGAVIDAIVAAHAAVSRDAWDPGAVFATVGKDRAALFKWVRDNTALVPYRGSLRGAVGVMMDRVGNSLDRSLLLANLLEKAGLEVRLANAQLTPDLVAKLVAAGKTRARPPLSTAHLDDAALIATLTKITGADQKATDAALAKQQAAIDAVLVRTKQRSESQAKALAALVPATGAAATSDEAYTDHWWVQVHDGDAWSDLDPSLPTAAPGEALAPAATDTVVPSDLADDRRHTLAIRVIGEIWHGAKREEAVLVETAFAPLSFYGQNVIVTNLALDLPDRKATMAAPDALAFTQQALSASREMAPVIRVGATPVVHFSVNDRGELLDLANGDENTFRLGRAVQHATQDGVGNATGMLDQLPGEEAVGSGSGSGSAPPPPPAAGPAFTAEWLEVEIRAPGSAPRTIRRTVFDSIGPVADRDAAHPPVLSDAARLERAYQLTGEIELLPMFAQIPRSFVVDRYIQTLVALREVLSVLASKKSIEAYEDKMGSIAGGPNAIYGLALARFADPTIYLDRLDVLAVRSRVIGHGKSFSTRHETDILANGVAVWPSNPDPRLARIAQGVRDTDLEPLASPCLGKAPCLRAPSTSELFATNGKDWAVNATPTGFPALDRSAGYTIVSRGASQQSWWRIDPATGETLGMNPLGGSVYTETALRAKFAENVMPSVGGFAACLYGTEIRTGSTVLACAGGAAAGLLLGTVLGAPAVSSRFISGGLSAANAFFSAVAGTWLGPPAN